MRRAFKEGYEAAEADADEDPPDRLKHLVQAAWRRGYRTQRGTWKPHRPSEAA